MLPGDSGNEKSQCLFTVVGLERTHCFDGISIFFCFLLVVLLVVSSVFLLLFSFQLNVVLQTGCIKFNSVVERSSCIDSRVSRILILVFTDDGKARQKSNERYAIAIDSNWNTAFSAHSLSNT